MSKILRRPMFRGGGKVSSYGNGIATGLGYKNGGRTGYAGGGQIGGGEIYGKRFPDGRYGFAKPSAYVEGYNRIYGSGTGSGAGTASTGTGTGTSGQGGNIFRNAYNKIKLPSLSSLKNFGIRSLGAVTGPAVGGTTAALSGPAAVSGLAYLNKPDTIEELKYMKEYDEGQIGSIIDETTSEDEFNQYFKDRTELADTEKYTALGKYDTGLTSSISDLEKAEKDAAIDKARKNKFTNTSTNDDTIITEEDYFSMLGGDKARRRDVGDMMTRLSALALKRGKPGEGKRTMTDIFSDVMAAEANAGPSRVEKIEEKVGDFKLKDIMAGKRNKEAIKLFMAQTDYTKKESFIKTLSELNKSGNSGKKGMSMAIQLKTGEVPTIIKDSTILADVNLKPGQIGKTYIIERQNPETKAPILIAVQITADENGKPKSNVLGQQGA